MKLGTLCYIRKDNHTLLLHRTKKKNDILAEYWIGLGGHVDIENGESPHDCIVREVREESGLVVEPKLRGIITFRNVEPSKDDWYAYVFTATQFTGKLLDSNEGDLQWISDEKQAEIQIPEGDRLFLQWLREEDRLFSAKFVYENGKLQDHDVIFY
jgi:8-oxo-dGTP diphosphatase